MLLLLAVIQTITLTRGKTVLLAKLDPTKEPSVVVSRAGKPIWQGILKKWHPWKIAAADVDGKGSQELIVGLHKFTRHRPERLHTLFIYGYDGDRIYPKWRGSTTGRDFIDFAVLQRKDGDMIVLVDRLLDGRYALAGYSWIGFGFRKVWEHGRWLKAQGLKVEPNGITILTDQGKVELTREGVPKSNIK